VKEITETRQIRMHRLYLIFRQECGHFMVGKAYHNNNNTSFSVQAPTKGPEPWYRCPGCSNSFSSPLRSEQEHKFWELHDGV
jgi:hypothetical protein